MVVLILTLFTIFTKPAKNYLTEYFTGYFAGKNLQLPEIPFQDNTNQQSQEEWATRTAQLPHCQFNISGRITQYDGEPIVNAEVTIHNSGIFNSGDFRFTDENGEFSYTEIGVETCDKDHFYVSINKNGYEPYYVLAQPDQEINVFLTYPDIY